MRRDMKIVFENFCCSLLTAYRWVPLLAALTIKGVSREKQEVAWDTLVAKFKSELKPKDFAEQLELLEALRKFLAENKSWIAYTLMDMHYYFAQFYKEGISEEVLESMRLGLYLERMHEQSRFLTWNLSAFELPGTFQLNILDFGCGTFPYVDVLNKANPSRLNIYLGIDKRAITKYAITEDAKIAGSVVTCKITVEEWLKKYGSEYLANILFMGEFLHCVESPELLIAQAITTMKALKYIMILEPTIALQNGLADAFPFHMKMHASSAPIDALFIARIAEDNKLKLTKQRASSQHTLYLLEKL